MKNFVVRTDVISRIEDGEYTNEDLNTYLGWAINKYATDVIDSIINYPTFYLEYGFLDASHLNKLVFYNDYKWFKYFVDKVKIESFNSIGSFGYPPTNYGLMKDICWGNKINFLKLIVDFPVEQLDFSRNEFVIVRETYKRKHYSILSMLLQRDEIKSNRKLYEKYSFILRGNKIKHLKEKIYIDK